MPIYEYECQGCGEVTEHLQKISDKPLRKCPCCGGNVKKLMSMNTFHLKGSGWYVTDYAGKKAPHTESTAKSETPAKTETKTDTAKKDKKND